MADLPDALRASTESGHRPKRPDASRRASSNTSRLPALAEHTAYQSISPTDTIRNRFRGRRGKYGARDDDDNTEPIPSPTTQHRSLGSLEAEVEAESIDIDTSTFDGTRIELREIGPGAASSQPYAGLRGGVDTVLQPTLAQGSPGYKQAESLDHMQALVAGRELAQKSGQIVSNEEANVNASLVREVAEVDISNLGGSQYDQRSTLSAIKNSSEARKSYFFPDDPVKPDWKPLTMRWPYISLLVIFALILAGVQEYMCQTSIRKAKSGGGLLTFHSPKDISTANYFTWRYMPTMVLVTYGLLWNVVDLEVKRLEPLYQLSKREGASARQSLNVNYSTSMPYLFSVIATRNRQWAVVYSSVATLLTSALVPVLQSASVSTYPKHAKDLKVEKSVRIHAVWSRCLTAALLVVAVIGVLLISSLRRKSGLLSDPKGIASIASMVTKSHILADFRGMDLATNATLDAQLHTKRYNLYKSSLWQGEYIMPSEKLPPPDTTENPHPIMLRLEAGIAYIAYLIIFVAIIPIFIFFPTVNNAVKNVPFIMTALATVIRLLWGTLDMSVRVTEPYYLLSERHAPPKTLTLDYSGTVAGYLFIKAVTNGHFLVAAVGLGAILAEVLTVCVTSFGVDGAKFVANQGDDDRYNEKEIFKSFCITLSLSFFILFYLTGVASAVYAQRRHKFLPRQPGSIAGVLAYIHQSRMLDDFIDNEMFDSRRMTRHLESLGHTYAFGWFDGRDLEEHCGVEQEEILSNYVHDYDCVCSRIASPGVNS